MKLSDNYTREDIDTLNVLGFIITILMFVMAAIAQIGGLI
jgi:hypothetical protein